MAFSVRISGYAAGSGEKLLELELPWWPAYEVGSDPRFTESVAFGAYLDRDADISLAEARLLHLRYRDRAESGAYALPAWRDRIGPMLAALDAAFGPRSAEFSRFHVQVFEWESGYS